MGTWKHTDVIKLTVSFVEVIFRTSYVIHLIMLHKIVDLSNTRIVCSKQTASFRNMFCSCYVRSIHTCDSRVLVGPFTVVLS